MIPDDEEPRLTRAREGDDPRGGATATTALAVIAVGISHCRRGEWYAGLHYLLRVNPRDGDVTLPGLYYSYLGHALARCEKQLARGVELCEHAVDVEFFQPENFLNLAWTRLLARDRRGAVSAMQRGLALAPAHVGLRQLAERLGSRRAPVLPFLPRTHVLNRRLGALRQALSVRR